MGHDWSPSPGFSTELLNSSSLAQKVPGCFDSLKATDVMERRERRGMSGRIYARVCHLPRAVCTGNDPAVGLVMVLLKVPRLTGVTGSLASHCQPIPDSGTLHQVLCHIPGSWHRHSLNRLSNTNSTPGPVLLAAGHRMLWAQSP